MKNNFIQYNTPSGFPREMYIKTYSHEYQKCKNP